MLTITDALIAEHRVFLDLFDHIEGTLPDLATLAEVRLLATLVERLLESHAKAERNLAYAALDHMLEESGCLDRLHQDHQEIDQSLRRIQMIPDFDAARQMMRAAMATSREHFELQLFPLLEDTLQSGTLTALGNARIGQHAAGAHGRTGL
jgi:hypothetical protein